MLNRRVTGRKCILPHQWIKQCWRNYIQYRKQLKILELFGTIEYEEDYDYKQQRQIE